MLKGGVVSGTMVISFFTVEGRMDVNRFLGIFSLAITAIAIVMTVFFYKESPVTLIASGRNDEAIRTLIILRGAEEETPDITKSFNELKEMVVEDKFSNSGIFLDGNKTPLVIVLLLRISFVLTFNYGLKFIHITITSNSASGIDYTFILNIIHTATVFCVLFTIDKGRRMHYLISAFGTSITLIVFGCLRASIFSNSELPVFLMFVAFEFFSAIGMGLTAHIYSTELFPTLKKPGSVAFTSIIEHCLQIVFVVWVENVIYTNIFDIALLLSSGIILAFIAFYLFYHLPETKNLSIRQTRSKFLK